MESSKTRIKLLFFFKKAASFKMEMPATALDLRTLLTIPQNQTKQKRYFIFKKVASLTVAMPAVVLDQCTFWDMKLKKFNKGINQLTKSL